MISVKNILVVLAVAFTAYFAVRGLWWTTAVPQPLAIVASLALYLAATWLCIFWEPVPGDETEGGQRAHRPVRMPIPATALALACALVVPSAVSWAVGAVSRTASLGTWYIGGIGALMVIVMVRRRPWAAWSGFALLAIASMAWMGPLQAFALGLIGSLVWLIVAQLVVFSIDRAARDTSRLARLQRAASAWQASQVVRQRERRVQVQKALAVAGPVLTRTVANGGALSDDDRLEARLAEGRLRDEMRGPRLLDDDVRAELERARRRGAHVTVLDEGGLDDADEGTLEVIREQLAETLRAASSNRLYIRTSPDERVAVTVVGRSPSTGGHSDEDAVDLWREIPHPGSD